MTKLHDALEKNRDGIQSSNDRLFFAYAFYRGLVTAFEMFSETADQPYLRRFRHSESRKAS